MAKQPLKYSSKPKPFPWVATLIAALAVVILAGAGWAWWQSRQSVDTFQVLVTQGQPALSKVQTGVDAGRTHVEQGRAVGYASRPATSGPHWPTWVNAGFYTEERPAETLVHSLEHGNVVIYYDQPDETALNTLKDWAGRFRGQWDGVVVVPYKGLGQNILLTAWNKSLRQERFDPAGAAAFIDAFRGRGPENPVR
ncbi:MAG: DUF3105 domain-containing protein [Thermaceae bacterium]|nr:DUF3105 domain-containing protein [Thermaceae bacterium]